MDALDLDALGVAPAPGRRRKRARRRPKAQARELQLSINSLLDILSVLLVFLMKTFSTSAVQIHPSRELSVPFTAAHALPEESTTVTVTRTHLMVDDLPVLALDGGEVDPASLAEDGLLIAPLLAALADANAREKRVTNRRQDPRLAHVLTVIADRNVSFPMLTRVVYTAGQAQFGRFELALIKAAP